MVFRRSDVYGRNEWSNYTNWPSALFPYDLVSAPTESPYYLGDTQNATVGSELIGPGKDIISNYTGGSSTVFTNHRITQTYAIENTKYIMTNCAIVIDGKYRENEMDAGVFIS